MEATGTKAMRGIRTYLERKGFEILEEGWMHGADAADFIAREEDDLVFVSCQVSRNIGDGFPEERADRGALERVAIAYLSEHPDPTECAVRFDLVSMMIVADDRALLRHHRNALCDV